MKRVCFSIALMSVMLFCVACKKSPGLPEQPEPFTFKNVVILGNSILFSKANPEVGWNGNWGMAASAADKDYVHLVTAKLKSDNPSCTINIQNVAQFEREFTTYNLDDNLRQLKDKNPDLLIIRIGENVADDFNAADFESRYTALINYFKSGNNSLTVLAVGSFWTGKDAVDVIMKKYSPFISLSPLGQDMDNYAWGLFDNIGVASHPNDKGMQAISDMIWTAVTKLKK